PGGHLRRDVDVHLDQLDPACQVAGELLQRGTDHAAGPAPGRPQIDDDRNLGGFCHVAEGGVVGLGDPRQRLMALTAPGRPGRRGRPPVHLAAVPAADQLPCHGVIIARWRSRLRAPRRRDEVSPRQYRTGCSAPLLLLISWYQPEKSLPYRGGMTAWGN